MFLIFRRRLLATLSLVFVAAGCTMPGEPPATATTAPSATVVPAEPQPPVLVRAIDPGSDPHSYSHPEEAVVRHLTLDLDVNFADQILEGSARIDFENLTGTDRLILDTRDLTIHQVTYDDGSEAEWYLGEENEIFGRPLVIAIAPETRSVVVHYETSPDAAAVQWLTPEQTAGGKDPFLFTQSQAILARTWVPLQDSPGVRFTYDARIKVPRNLLAVMSAENPTSKSSTGVYQFRMPQPISSYLMALAVGDLEFRSLGPNSGVYAEPEMIERAEWELADTPEMIEKAEKLYGPYRWGRYDILVLPPSFPFGGMENPRLTFATPTIIAGDRSLVSLVAHELAHSWSGNLVTNATWNDFWLNEGFTDYFTFRIMEAVYGREYSEMLALLAMQDLQEEINSLGAASPDTFLKLDLEGRDPDEGMTDIAYEKGYFFLRLLEETYGRELWDQFLRGYFDKFAFSSLTTEEFLQYLDDELISKYPAKSADLNVDRWVYGPSLPSDSPQPRSRAFERVETEIDRFATGTHPSQLEVESWTTHEWLHFLRNLPRELSDDQLRSLDESFSLSETGNSEILFAWLMNTVRNDYDPGYRALEKFLTSMGRNKFLEPLYAELAKTAKGKQLAMKIYAAARSSYHPISVQSIDAVLDWENR